MNSHMSDIPLHFSASAHFPSNTSALITFSQTGSDPVQNVHSPNQTGLNPWQYQYLVTQSQSAFAVLVLQDAVQLVTQRAREALNVQRASVRRVVFYYQGEILAATHQYEADVRQNHVNTLARTNETTQVQRADASWATRTDILKRNHYRDSLGK